jgi:hypothetical protein
MRAKGIVPDLRAALEATALEAAKAAAINYRDDADTSDEIAKLWIGILLHAGAVQQPFFDAFNQWRRKLKRPLRTGTLVDAARACAHAPSAHAAAMAFAGEAFERTSAERSNASNETDIYVGLARAILPVNKAEAQQYFDRAVQVASKIGDENLDRWAALLDLADQIAADEQPRPELAYRLSRCAEVTHDYADGDHFDWRGTVKAIVGLCPSSSLVILSRWRDRRFGSARCLLPITAKALVKRGKLPSREALALIAFRAEWDDIGPLVRALESANTNTEKEKFAGAFSRYFSLDEHAASDWKKLKDALDGHGLTFPDLDERIAISARREAADRARKSSSGFGRASSRGKQVNWNAVFAGVDLVRDAKTLTTAWERARASKDFTWHDQFYGEAFARVPVGQEAVFLRALENLPEFDLLELRRLLPAIPLSWKSLLSVRAVLPDLLKTICRRFADSITKSRYYQTLPLTEACELAGVPELEVTQAILDAIGESAQLANAGRLFTLIGLLAPHLTVPEAHDALGFGLGLFDAQLEDRDGDGPWSEALRPPSEIEAALAGYIWGSLAAPEAAVRWQGAHTVRLLCELGSEGVLATLGKLASLGQRGCFADPSLPFYGLHAQLWFVIALVRAAMDTPALVAPHNGLLIRFALEGEPHVLIRHFAAAAVRALVEAKSLHLSPGMEDAIVSVNRSPFPLICSDSYSRKFVDPDAEDVGEGDRYYFGIDIGPYWYAPLGRCFAVSQAYIERQALQVIRKDWQQNGSGRWDEDERGRRQFYRGRDAYHSHSELPATDTLQSYLSYHAMMIVAGRLLVRCPVHQNRDADQDDFVEWLSGYALSRADGRWLFDLRDPVPAERPAWMDTAQNEGWMSAISRSDLDGALFSPRGNMNVWSNWTEVSGRREQNVSIHSALVAPERAHALLRALHTVKDHHDYRIPDAEDDLQIAKGAFQLSGWILDRSREGRIDDRDPWSGRVRFAPPHPAPLVAQEMGLTRDAGFHVWRDGATGAVALISEVWGTSEPMENEPDERGHRLTATREFICALLKNRGKTLIVKITLHRRVARYHYEKEDNSGYGPYITRILLVEPGGKIVSAVGPAPAWPKAGR